MHYNLHERLKPKKRTPFKKIAIASVVVLVVIAVYIVVFSTGGPGR